MGTSAWNGGGDDDRAGELSVRIKYDLRVRLVDLREGARGRGRVRRLEAMAIRVVARGVSEPETRPRVRRQRGRRIVAINGVTKPRR
jgi:hypothetical protein